MKPNIKPLTPVYSLYWKNINQEILRGQANVFSYLGIPLNQILIDGKNHGQWMEEILSCGELDEIVVFCDVDAFPLTFAAYFEAVDFAKADGIFGLAQFSTHTNTTDIYAGPMFLALKRKIWHQLGRPSLVATTEMDAAENLSITASQKNIPLKLEFPNACIQPKWALADKGVFGVGTFYANLTFFHLFESRSRKSVKLFRSISGDVSSGRSLRFDHYLSLASHQSHCDFIVRNLRSIRAKAKTVLGI